MPLDLVLREDVIKFDVKRHGLGSLPKALRQKAERDPKRWKTSMEGVTRGMEQKVDDKSEGLDLKEILSHCKSKIGSEVSPS